MIDPVTVGAATVLVPLAIGIPILLLRGAARLVKRKPSRLTGWTSALPPKQALDAAAAAALALGYRVVVRADAESCLVIASPMTAFTWGFFHPIYISTELDGRTRVEIGITSRLVQVGPLVTRAHHRFMERLGAPLGLSPSR